MSISEPNLKRVYYTVVELFDVKNIGSGCGAAVSTPGRNSLT